MACSVAICAGPHLSFLDHLAPLCDLFDMPLYAPYFDEIPYPHIKVVDSLADFETFFYVEPSRLHEEAFKFDNLLIQEKKRSVCGLHGNSNKCRDVFWAERFVEEDIVMVYGNYMKDFFQEKGVWQRLKNPIFCGNYRFNYFKKYHDAFKVKLPGSGKKVLYAPTWSYWDATDNSPFFECHTRLLDDVPEGFSILVKLHPYMYRLHPEKVRALEEKYRDNPRVFILKETSLVYPILEGVDIYIGDYSSVGYDFLAFDRPLFFFADKVDPLLAKCGVKIGKGNIFSQLENEGSSEERQKLYHHCFADVKEEELKCKVSALLSMK